MHFVNQCALGGVSEPNQCQQRSGTHARALTHMWPCDPTHPLLACDHSVSAIFADRIIQREDYLNGVTCAVRPPSQFIVHSYLMAWRYPVCVCVCARARVRACVRAAGSPVDDSGSAYEASAPQARPNSGICPPPRSLEPYTSALALCSCRCVRSAVS